jgi:hypothetical protein
LILAVALFLFVALGLLVLFFVLCLQVGAPVRCGEQRRPSDESPVWGTAHTTVQHSTEPSDESPVLL